MHQQHLPQRQPCGCDLPQPKSRTIPVQKLKRKLLPAGMNELQRMLHDPSAEPTSWSIKYLNDSTDNFSSKVLGEGAFGKVFFGCDKMLGFQFAVKRVLLTVPDPDSLKTIIDSFRREVLVRPSFSFVSFQMFASFFILFSLHSRTVL